MLRFFFPFLLLISLTGLSQETFGLRWKIALNEIHAWDADQGAFLYLYNNEEFSKIDSTGKRVLTQSPKSLGNISKIDATNWLKLAVFSEEQQQVCYLDNALSIQGQCIQLTDYKVELAQLVATSVQTDRLWVFDQLNSELRLITLRSAQQQTVMNMRSILDFGMPKQLFEFGNQLYITDAEGQIAIFDNYGTFIGSEKFEGSFIQPFQNALLVANGNEIYAQNLETGEKVPFFSFVSEKNIEQFSFNGRNLYVGTASEIFCFRLK